MAVSNKTLTNLRHSVAEITTKSNNIDDHLNLARKMNSNASLSVTRSRVAFQVIQLMKIRRKCGMKLNLIVFSKGSAKFIG